MKALQIIVNVALYAGLVYLAYWAFVHEKEPFLGGVVSFVLLVSLIIMFIPRLHAPRVSPGEYPFED